MQNNDTPGVGLFPLRLRILYSFRKVIGLAVHSIRNSAVFRGEGCKPFYDVLHGVKEECTLIGLSEAVGLTCQS